MSYDPKAITSSDRSFALNMMWVGLGASLILLVGKVFGFFDHVESIAGGFAAGSMIGVVFAGRHDEYFQRLVAFASRWSSCVIGLWLFASIASITDELVTDHILGLIIVVATFHVALAAARLRGY